MLNSVTLDNKNNSKKVSNSILTGISPEKIKPLDSSLVSVKLAKKSKLIFNDWGIAFDGEGVWSFGNGFSRNVVMFGVNNSSSSYNVTRVRIII